MITPVSALELDFWGHFKFWMLTKIDALAKIIQFVRLNSLEIFSNG